MKEPTEQERRLRALVLEDAMGLYLDRVPPAYVPQLVCVDCVTAVLCGAKRVLEEMNVDPRALDGVDPADLAPYWGDLLRQLYSGASPWAPVDVGDCTLDLVKKVAGGVHAMFWEKLRYRHFLINGAPPGVQQLPRYSQGEAQKSFAKNNGWWQLPGKSWTQYVSCSQTLPQRKQNLRASRCAVDDLVDPRAFA